MIQREIGIVMHWIMDQWIDHRIAYWVDATGKSRCCMASGGDAAAAAAMAEKSEK